MTRKIVVKGSSGAGKSTFAAELSRRLSLAHIELDGLFHGLGWITATEAQFRARVEAALAAAPDGWVVDGNYDSNLGDAVVGQADTLVWLDMPLHLKLYRLWRRTIRRVHGRIDLWNGNRETLRNAFLSRNSIFVWAVKTHFRHRRLWPARFGSDPRLVRLTSSLGARRCLTSQGHELSPIKSTIRRRRITRPGYCGDQTEPAGV